MHPGPLGQPPLASDASRLRPQSRQSPSRISTPRGTERLLLRAMPLRGRSLPGGRDLQILKCRGSKPEPRDSTST